MDALSPLHATVPEVKDHVAGFVFVSGGDEHSDRNGHICKIIDRADPDGEELDPVFMVKFGDGMIYRVYSQELTPWYPT
jgi:hypothetical protein